MLFTGVSLSRDYTRRLEAGGWRLEAGGWRLAVTEVTRET
jgi:hypothetical protein